MLDKIEIVRPTEIAKRSMEIITEELNGRTWPEPEFSIIKRCIHTSADFDYADNLCFSEGAAMLGVEALRRGAAVVTDTKMAWSGINKKKLSEYGGEAFCFMSDEDVAEEAKKRECTRAAVCMERGASLDREVIFAVGNAPTALIRLYELIQEGRVRPCGGSQGTDHDGGRAVYCAQRKKGRQQHRGDHLQCHAVCQGVKSAAAGYLSSV